jgi:hypothetical protein
MPTIIEKGIQLDFPASWAVVKYDGDIKSDNASFYRTRIESQVQNVRGVDVVSQTAGPATATRLLLIEVKDYRISAHTADQDAVKLRQTVVQKALNTLSGLYAAARVADPELQRVATCLFDIRLRIEVILLLEQPPLPVAPSTVAQKLRRENPQKSRSDLQLQLTSRLSTLGFDFHLRNCASLSPADGWSARAL